ncbi:ATP synthase-coupling factor 6, mitochondrial-like [Lycorma delicatula]|uniref:ATP synthase-coupling factor 6, mitochondrial-like n=1 Tax=Lycorma delicatula TaxID=130591 RepID=UPI003F514EF6
MLASQLLTRARTSLNVSFRRNIGATSVALQQTTDPIQKLFIEKIREYKSKSDGGRKLVDPSPEIQRELKSELRRLLVQFGGQDGEDMTKFPTFQFPEAAIDPVTEPKE